MATNQVIIPILNPLEFHPKFPTVFPQYNSKDLGDYAFADRILVWQEKVYYKQKWQTSDIIPFQFESNMSPLTLDLYNVLYDNPLASIVMDQVAVNPQMAGFYIYQATISLAGLEEGCYYVEFRPGTNPADIEVSEPLSVKTLHDETVYYQYKHSHFHGDVVFETGIEFTFRVEGARGKLYPASDDTYYRDQKLNPYKLTGKPYKSFDYSHGGSFGIPDWVVDKINWIWSCDSVRMNGKSFCQDPGTNNSAQIQINEEENYPMYGLTMQISPGNNRASKIIAPSVDTTKRLVVGLITDGTLFGDMSVNVGDNLIPLNYTE